MLIRITSGDNSRIRLVRKLSTRKGRSTEGRFAVEGRNLVSEVLERGLDVDFIMIPAGAAGDVPDFIRDCIKSPDMTVCETAPQEASSSAIFLLSRSISSSIKLRVWVVTSIWSFSVTTLPILFDVSTVSFMLSLILTTP